MSLCKMQGYADNEELLSLYWELLSDEKKRSSENKFCLFVVGKGFMNGEETFQYLKEKFTK